MVHWIGETFTSDEGWRHLEQLVDIGDRLAGSDGEQAAIEATAQRLQRVGARNVRLEGFDIQGWARSGSDIRVDGTSQSCIALPRSPTGTITGPLVDLGYALPDDFEDASLDGAVVLARSDVPDHFDRYIHRREKYYRAVDAGASGFIYRNHVEGCLPPTGSVGTPDQPIGEIPAVGVSAEVGARLARRWVGEDVVIEVDAEIYDASSANVHGRLGPETSDRIIVSSHVDAHDISEGAGDNAAGTAMVVEIAKALTAREEDLDTGIELVCYGAEEVGLRGSEHHATHVDLGTVKAILNNDGVVRDRTLSLSTHGFDPLGTAVESVSERFGHPIQVVPEQSPHSDHWPFVKRGVPGYHASSDTGSSGRGWGHTASDTIDKLERRTLCQQAILLTELTVHVADQDFVVPHTDPGEIASALEDQHEAEGMKLIGDWPF